MSEQERAAKFAKQIAQLLQNADNEIEEARVLDSCPEVVSVTLKGGWNFFMDCESNNSTFAPEKTWGDE